MEQKVENEQLASAKAKATEATETKAGTQKKTKES